MFLFHSAFGFSPPLASWKFPCCGAIKQISVIKTRFYKIIPRGAVDCIKDRRVSSPSVFSPPSFFSFFIVERFFHTPPTPRSRPALITSMSIVSEIPKPTKSVCVCVFVRAGEVYGVASSFRNSLPTTTIVGIFPSEVVHFCEIFPKSNCWLLRFNFVSVFLFLLWRYIFLFALILNCDMAGK